MVYFENPANGYREAVGGADILATFFLGPIWYFKRGVYAIATLDFIFYAIAILGLASRSDDTQAASFLLLLPLHLVTTFGAAALLRGHFRRNGWKEITPDSRGRTLPRAEQKICPDCAETVQAAARICKHCRHEFPARIVAAPAPDVYF